MEPEEQNRMPVIGEPAPEFEALTTHGPLKLSDFRGKWVILFSHPADFTPVCTTEFIAFTAIADELARLNVQLIGLSIDSVHSHLAWVRSIKEKMGVEIPFPVIADGVGVVAMKLGMLHPGKGSNTVRSVFIVDDKGFVRLMIYYPQEIGRSVDEVLRALKALQISDKHNVALPENWPQNELLKDRAILKPAADEKTAEERKKLDCYDWWFCHKKL